MFGVNAPLTGRKALAGMPTQAWSSSRRAGHSWVGTAGVVLLFLAAGVFLGLVATTGSALYVSIAAAMILGPLLLARPAWVMWLVLVLGLTVSGVLPIWAEGAASRSVWGISGLAFLLFVLAVFKVISTPGLERQTPMFIWLFLAFAAYAIVNAIAQSPTLYQGTSGVKRYLQAYGVMFALAWLTWSDVDIRRWRVLFLVVALAQLPWAIYERLQLVPIREGMAQFYPGMVPIDVVAGTFGSQIIAGGASGEMAWFIIVVLVFLLARWQFGALSGPRLCGIGLLVVSPLFLGETKVVLLLLPLAVLVLYRTTIFRRPLVALSILTLSAALTFGALMAYLTYSEKSIAQQLQETVRYNFGEQGYGVYKLNRTSVLTFWASKQGLDDPAGLMFGHGTGSSHDPTGGDVSRRYPGFGIGFTSASAMLWEQGVLGTLVLLAAFVAAWRCAGRLQLQAEVGWLRADAAAIQTAVFLAAGFYIYAGSPTSTLTYQLVVASIFGYLAWLHRRYRQPAPT